MCWKFQTSPIELEDKIHVNRGPKVSIRLETNEVIDVENCEEIGSVKIEFEKI